MTGISHDAQVAPSSHANWQAIIEKTVVGLGYDPIACERSARGLLRVTIDRLDGQFVLVEDCEKVTRQLQYVLEVEGVAYERLEISSPGLDRPLRTASHFARFVGEQVEITLKAPMGQGQGNRKKFRGTLEAQGEGWRLLWQEEAPSRLTHAAQAAQLSKTAKVKAKKAAAAEVLQVLSFTLDEVREAHLVPVLNFKGRPDLAARQLSVDNGSPEE